MMTPQEFFECLGYLAAPHRETKLDAEVPESSRARFEEKYYKLTGIHPIPDNHNYYILHPGADKWGIELRIYFIANNNIPSALNRMRVTPRPGTKYNSRINDNKFIWKLVEYGFRLDDLQNLNLIKRKVPSQYMTDFNRGLNR